jgi:hypothetical protein
MATVAVLVWLACVVYVFAEIWLHVAREERTLNATATRECWDKGVRSLNEFRERTRRRQQHHA